MENLRMHIKSIYFSLWLGVVGLLFAIPAQAVPVTINTGNYTGLWAIDSAGSHFSGPQTLDLAPGGHALNPGTVGVVVFSVDAGGQVTLAPVFDGISATGGAGELTLITIPVPVDPGAFTGDWEISRVRNAAPGAETVDLVPSENVNFSGLIGVEYLVSTGIASSAFFVALRGDGSMTFRAGGASTDAAFDDAGTLRFRNTDVSVHDRDGTLTPWLIRQVTQYGTGDATVTLVPGVQYLFNAASSGAFFTVANPCAVSPPSLDLAGIIFELSCGIPDQDGDGVPDVSDNCPAVANPDQIDLDQDGFGDSCDTDDDNDGVTDANDNCPQDPNPDQADTDGDGQGDACDGDDDGDGVVNELDLCPFSPPALAVDSDGCTGVQLIARLCRRDDFIRHGQYVSCVAHAANEAANDGLISMNEKSRFVKAAAKNR